MNTHLGLLIFLVDWLIILSSSSLSPTDGQLEKFWLSTRTPLKPPWWEEKKGFITAMWGGNPGPQPGLYDTTPAGVLKWLVGSFWWPSQGQPWQQYQGGCPSPGAQSRACPMGTAAYLPNLFCDVSLWFWSILLLRCILLLPWWFCGWLSTALFLLKLAKPNFHRMQISVLTDCTFYWLSAANPSGKQKPQPLPQTSLFLLRGNNLESNLQLTKQWNLTWKGLLRGAARSSKIQRWNPLS